MTAIEHNESSMLKLAQFLSFIATNEECTEKDIELILRGVDLNLKATDRISEDHGSKLSGNTLLHLAYRKFNICAYDILIRKGADFTAKNKDGNTVLHQIFRFFCKLSCFTWWDIKENELSECIKRIPFIASTLSAHVKYGISENPSDSNGLTHFHIACAMNDLKVVEFFLRNGVSVNQTVTKAMSREHFEGYTGLHFAAQFGYFEMAQVLLYNGANVDLEDSRGKTPLHIALERNIAVIDSTRPHFCYENIQMNEQVINLLFNKSIDMKIPPLCVVSAQQTSNLDGNLLALVNNASQCVSIDSKNWPGYTALHFAAHVHVETVKLLMQHGGDIEAKDAKDVTPFDICSERYRVGDISGILGLAPKWKNIVLSDGKTKLVEFLNKWTSLAAFRIFLQNSVGNTELFVPLDSPLWPGFTVLHIAVLLSEREKCKLDYKEKEEHLVFHPDLTVVTEILKYGADVTFKDHRNWTPIHLAFRLGKNKVLKLLLQHHYKMQNPADDDNLSHLHIACADDNRGFVENLLRNGADVNAAYNGDSWVFEVVYPGWTPLHIAVNAKNSEITKLLLKFGADVHAIDKHGFTPIHGLRLLPKDINRLMFSLPNLRDHIAKDLGLSYLHVACLCLNVDAVKQLLDLGVDVNKVITFKVEIGEATPNVFSQKYYDGRTPLHCALRNLHLVSPTRVRLVGLLIERGADVLIKDSRGNSPLSAILESSNIDCLNVLSTALRGNDELRQRVEEETGVTMLHVACRKVDLDLIRKLLEDGADVNARIPEDSTVWPGFTPLHVLILTYDDVDGAKPDELDQIMKHMLRNGADVTLSNAERRTSLHTAYHKFYDENDNSSLARLSLMLKAQKNFEVNPTSVEGISHFHIACHLLDVDVVENFLNLGSVDVNSTTNVFSGFNVAACTPLLLTCRTKNWRSPSYNAKSMAESFAQLKIVDSLIKRGARVDVEDVQGNTPAHYAAFGSSSKENLLERLAKGGADVNARNARGESPLELALKKRGPTAEDIRRLVACGCRLNAFNPLTEEGYVALTNAVLNHGDMQRLLFGTFVNSPDLMRNDDANRTAIHGLVCFNSRGSSETQYAELLDTLMKFDCDVDDQDSLGRTALHLAAQFRNESAVAGLLLVGADINVTDHKGKTPFAYVLEPCSRCNNPGKDHNQYSHLGLFKAFVMQIRKLQLCNLDLHEANERLSIVTFERFGAEFCVGEDVYLSELETMSKLIVEPCAIPLADFISDTAAVIDYPLMSREKRAAVDEFFRSKTCNFRKEFKRVAGIFQLQYRQAVLRRKYLDKATNSLSVLMRLRLPDLCSHIILRLLKNSELRNMISSTSQRGIRNVDIEG